MQYKWIIKFFTNRFWCENARKFQLEDLNQKFNLKKPEMDRSSLLMITIESTLLLGNKPKFLFLFTVL